MLAKTKKTLFFLFLLTSLQVNAQSYLGLRSGLSFANVRTVNIETPEPGPDHINGINAALFVELGISKSFAIQPELNFLQKGYRVQEMFDGLTFDASVKLNYLELPILFKYRYGNPDAINIYAIAGPSLGYAYSGRFIDNTFDFSRAVDFEVDGEFGRVDVSAVIGAGANFPVGPGAIVFDLRYHFGLSSLLELDPNVEDTEKLQNRLLNISIGYRIPIGSSGSSTSE
ncbi:MAG: porin family protein [Bacteroidota bacterium]